jgi:hypothetical protein
MGRYVEATSQSKPAARGTSYSIVDRPIVGQTLIVGLHGRFMQSLRNAAAPGVYKAPSVS